MREARARRNSRRINDSEENNEEVKSYNRFTDKELAIPLNGNLRPDKDISCKAVYLTIMGYITPDFLSIGEEYRDGYRVFVIDLEAEGLVKGCHQSVPRSWTSLSRSNGR